MQLNDEFLIDPLTMKVCLKLSGAVSHSVELGDSATGNIARIDNAIDGIPDRLSTAKRRLMELHSQVTAEEELKREFSCAQEFREKSASLVQLNAELTLHDRKPATSDDGNRPDGEAALKPLPNDAPEFVKYVNF